MQTLETLTEALAALLAFDALLGYGLALFALIVGLRVAWLVVEVVAAPVIDAALRLARYVLSWALALGLGLSLAAVAVIFAGRMMGS